jgi:predicted DNA binding protein
MRKDKSNWSVDGASVNCIERRTNDTDSSVYEVTLISDSERIRVKVKIGPDSRELIQDLNRNKNAVVIKYVEGWLNTAWNPSIDREILMNKVYLSRILETE